MTARRFYDVIRSEEVWYARPSAVGGTFSNGVVYLDEHGTRTAQSRWELGRKGIRFRLRTGATRQSWTDRDRVVENPECPANTSGPDKDGRYETRPFADWDSLAAYARERHGILRWEYVDGGWLGRTDRADDARPCCEFGGGYGGGSSSRECPLPVKRDGLCGIHAGVSERRAVKADARREQRAAEDAAAERARDLCRAVEDVRRALVAAVPFEIAVGHSHADRWDEDEDGDGEFVPSAGCSGRLAIDVESGRALADFLADLTGAGLPEYLR